MCGFYYGGLDFRLPGVNAVNCKVCRRGPLGGFHNQGVKTLRPGGAFCMRTGMRERGHDVICTQTTCKHLYILIYIYICININYLKARLYI